jgi:hypothetical protein
MRYKKFTILSLLLAVLIIALILASLVERQAVIGQSTTRSPDGNWCLDLKLVEHSTLFRSRKILHADIEHRTNEDWRMSTSTPLDDADRTTISNQDQNYPITWSDDSATVTYWINKQLEDSMKIETSGGQFEFQRELNSFSYTFTPTTRSTDLPKDGG